MFQFELLVAILNFLHFLLIWKLILNLIVGNCTLCLDILVQLLPIYFLLSSFFFVNLCLHLGIEGLAEALAHAAELVRVKLL